MVRIWRAFAVALCAVAVFGSPAPVRMLSDLPGNLEGEWAFALDPGRSGEQVGYQLAGTPDTDWRRIRVPGYWEPQGVTGPGGQGYDGVGWYRLRFRVPASWKGRVLRLSLGSVDDADRTFLNGRLLGETSVDTANAVLLRRVYRVPADRVRAGSENVLAVRVEDGGGPGGLMGPTVSMLPEDLARRRSVVPQGGRPFDAMFQVPPGRNRILKIIHGWPDDPREQDDLIARLVSEGFGGVVCNVSFNQYLRSEPRWRALVRGLARAKAAGMTLWWYDEAGYPSGTAGGLTLQGHPEMEAMGLLTASAAGTGRLDVALPPGNLVSAVACPEVGGQMVLGSRLDLRREVAGGYLRWTAPSGRWRVVVATQGPLFAGTHAEIALAEHHHQVNIANPQAIKRFLQVNHEPYAAHLGKDLGKTFVSTFTDEPSLMSLYMKAMPYAPLPWSASIEATFRRASGVGLDAAVPALVADAGSEGKRLRYLYWRSVGEVTSDSYFGQIRRWCDAHKLLSGGHPLMEEAVAAQVPLYGDFMRCCRQLTAPSIDCLTSVPAEVPWSSARLVCSAGELEGNTSATMCETSDFVQTYRPTGDTRPARYVTVDEMRGTCNRLMYGGINTITSYYSFTGISTEQIRGLNATIGRTTLAIGGGHQVADIAMVYPTESIWPRFTPSRHMVSECADAQHIESVTRGVESALYRSNRDFTYIDSKAILESRVRAGAMQVRDLTWRVVVLPAVDTLPAAAWRKLETFVLGGGILVAVGELPANDERSFPSAAVSALARRLFTSVEQGGMRRVGLGHTIYLPDGTTGMLPIALDTVVPAPVKAGAATPIRATRRQIGRRAVTYLINDSDSRWAGTVGLACAGPGRLMDPETGRITRIADTGQVRLSLGAYGSAIVESTRFTLPPLRKTAGTGMPGVSLVSLRTGRPDAAAGEWVAGSIEPAPEYASPERGAWWVRGRLKKGGVDTFLFAPFRLSAPLDLRGALALDISTWAPAGQSPAPRLLVQLHDRNGAVWFAEIDRPLSVPGLRRCLVGMDQFGPAPWAAGAGKGFDMSAVTAVVVGWGGYFGRADEVVSFAVAAPVMLVRAAK